MAAESPTVCRPAFHVSGSRKMPWNDRHIPAASKAEGDAGAQGAKDGHFRRVVTGNNQSPVGECVKAPVDWNARAGAVVNRNNLAVAAVPEELVDIWSLHTAPRANDRVG